MSIFGKNKNEKTQEEKTKNNIDWEAINKRNNAIASWFKSPEVQEKLGNVIHEQSLGEISDAYEMYEQGKSLDAIAEHFNNKEIAHVEIQNEFEGLNSDEIIQKLGINLDDARSFGNQLANQGYEELR